MSDHNDTPQTPKFTVIDRRKLRDEEAAATSEAPTASASTPPPAPAPTAADAEPKSAPRLTLVESPARQKSDAEPTSPAATPVASAATPPADDLIDDATLPPAPTTEEMGQQHVAYLSSTERLDDLVRAQNPGMAAPEKIGFSHLVQQLYVSALMQMGAGTPEGQRPRLDILGARQTIDLIAILAEKTTGNLAPDESRLLDTVLFELRMTFLEITRMVSMQPANMPPPPGGNPTPGSGR